MKKTSLLLTACASLIASNIAIAAEPAPFKDADSNGDGVVNATEFKSLKLEKEFAKLDEDGNGKLSKYEYSVILEEECD